MHGSQNASQIAVFRSILKGESDVITRGLLYMNVPLAVSADITCVCGLAVGSRLIQITRRATCHRHYYWYIN